MMPTFADSSVPPPRGWEEFEDIVLSAARVRWGSSDFFRNGRKGQHQYGIDIYGHDRAGVSIGIQCKNTPGGLKTSTVDDEVAKAEAFYPAIDRLYITTTAQRDAGVQAYVRTLTENRSRTGLFSVYVLFWEDIVHDISSDPSLIRQHFPHYALLDAPTVRRDSGYRWSWTSVKGSQLTLLHGTAATAREPNNFPPATFPSDSTAILGAATTALMESLVDTSAEWTISFTGADLLAVDRAYLVVASVRYFAGLHTKVYDSKAKIELNGSSIDYFGLREIPPHHTDYFHRLPLPDVHFPEEIEECETKYCWRVPNAKFLRSSGQRVTLTIDKYVRWDIDYLGILVRIARRA